MSSRARYLVTADDFRIWPAARSEIVAINEACFPPGDIDFIDEKNITLMPHYGLDEAERARDHELRVVLEGKLFPEAVKILNDYHGIDRSERYWKILIGHWFRRTLLLTINRVRTVEKAIELMGANRYIAYQPCLEYLTAIGSHEARNQPGDRAWNSMIYGYITKLLFRDSCQVILVKHQPIESKIKNFFLKDKILDWILSGVSFSLGLFSKSKDVFIYKSYIRPWDKICLHFKLKQVPQLWYSVEYNLTAKVNKTTRGYLASEFEGPKNCRVEQAFRHIFFRIMPRAFIEGFEELKRCAACQRWPNSPRAIFTSNAFDTNDVFKFWLANHTALGVPYYVGQHGANYGTSRYANPTIEEITADKFLTWGWEDSSSKYVRGDMVFNGAERLRPRKRGGLLLVLPTANPQNNTWDDYSLYSYFLMEVQEFIRNLSRNVKPMLTVRLHPDHSRAGFQEMCKLKAFDSTLLIDDASPFHKLLTQNRLVVYAYDSTGFLEALASNFPTMAFWPFGLSYVRPSVRKYYQRLINAGILFTDAPAICASEISSNWCFMHEWWSRPEVQEARLLFCDRFARNRRGELCRTLFQLLSD